MTIEAKIRRIGTGYGILIPKKQLQEIRVKEGDLILIGKIEKPVKEIRGILKHTRYKFEREHRDHDLAATHG